MWVSVDSKGNEKNLPTPIEYCAIRQIAHEIILTLRDIYPQFPYLPIIPRQKDGFICGGMSHIPA